MLELAQPWALALLPAPLLVWWLMPAHREPVKAVRLPFLQMLADAVGQQPGEGSVILARTSLQWLVAVPAWVLLVVAVAGPQRVGEPIERVQASRDVMLAVDISGSMDQADLAGADGSPLRRLDAVKQVISDFIAAREGDRVGLILFGSKPYLQIPFTQDLALAQALVDASEVNMAGPNTALGDAIGLAIRTFEGSQVERRLLILLTDGSDTGSRMTPRNAAEVARQRGVVVHTIGMGDPDAGGDDRVDFEVLETVASAAGGRFFEAADAAALEDVYRQIDAIDPREVKTASYRPRHSLVHWPAGAVALLLVGFYLLTLGRARAGGRS